jgi:ERCC4-related helicase
MCERVLRDFYESGGKQHQSTWNKNTEFQATLNQIAKYRLEGAGLGSTRFPPHPKMEKLNEILVEHFDVPDASETRVMVFTNFRESVDEIVAHLNANESGIIKAHRFIGQAGGKGGDKGMSQKEQLDVSPCACCKYCSKVLQRQSNVSRPVNSTFLWRLRLARRALILVRLI